MSSSENLEILENLEEYDNRPSWDDYFKDLVIITAKRSPCKRLQVGCILVNNNRIISQGYNGFLPGANHISVVRNNHEQSTVHAEQNAIADCAKRGVSCNNSIAYITHYPCIHCCKMLLAAGIKEIKYIDDYHNDELNIIYLEQLKVPINKL